MRTQLSYIFSFAFFISAFVNSLLAQESWDLQKCVNYAIENSLTIQAADYNIKSAEINEKFNTHQRYPSLSGNSGVGWNFGRSIDPTTNEFITETFFSNTYSLNTGMILYDGFRIKNSIRQSRFDTDAAEDDKKQTERDLSLNVAIAYLNVLFAQENLGNSEAQLELSIRQLEQVDKLIEAGNRPRNDRLDLVAQVTIQEQNVITDQNNIDIQMLGLKQLMNMDPSYPLTIVPPRDNIEIETDPGTVTFAEVFELALRNQPGIQAGENRLRSAELGVDIANANYYPTFGVGGNLGTNYSNKGINIDGFMTDRFFQTVYINQQPVEIGTDQEIPITSKKAYGAQLSDNLSYGFGFNLSIPIYNNYSSKASVEQAKIGVLNQKNLNEQIIQSLKTSVQLSLADARAAKKALEAAQNTARAQQAAFENAEQRYELGIINTYDFIQARNDFDSSNVNLIIAKYDYLFKLKLLDFYMGIPLTLD